MTTTKYAPTRASFRHYLHTVRYLEWVQITGRLSLLAKQKVLRRLALWRKRYSAPLPQEWQSTPLAFAAPAQPNAAPTHTQEYAQNTFTFLNQRLELGEPLAWFHPQATQLWLYHLHYFDYVTELAAQFMQGDESAYFTFRRLVQDWQAHCPVATPLAWDPYPTSLRIANWLRGYTWFQPMLRQDPSFAKALIDSLFRQARYLEDHLEYHLLGNHLIENGRALLMAGLFFQGEAAQRWRKKGGEILWTALHEQFLADGGHYERSPMYHERMLELYEEVVLLLSAQGEAISPTVEQRLQQMRNWLTLLRHPDGKIALFNDAAFHPTSLSQPPAEKSKTPALVALPASGYFVFQDPATGNFLAADCGPLGPDAQPGHGHCDALSYELSLGGQRMIVDSGVSTYYGDLARRHYYRSVYAHNTVVVDGEEQSEIWGRFRVGRRAYPIDVQWANSGPRLSYVSGGHTGYRRLPGNVTHHRWICWVARSFWLICDRISGTGVHEAESLIHFHPDVTVVQPPSANERDAIGIVQLGQQTLTVVPFGVTQLQSTQNPRPSWYAPEFGQEFPNAVWSLHRTDALPFWFGYLLWPHADTPTLTIEETTAQSCRLTIKTPGQSYHLVCTQMGVMLT